MLQELRMLCGAFVESSLLDVPPQKPFPRWEGHSRPGYRRADRSTHGQGFLRRHKRGRGKLFPNALEARLDFPELGIFRSLLALFGYELLADGMRQQFLEDVPFHILLGNARG